jgi:hypothetical protein
MAALSRVLTTLLLLQAGYAYVPYSSLESVIEQSKEAYYLALRQTQGTIRTELPNWQPWLVFFLRSLAEQVRRLEKKVEREKIVLAAMPELSAADRRVRPRARARHDWRCHQADRASQPQHAQATFPCNLVERGTAEPARQWPLVGFWESGTTCASPSALNLRQAFIPRQLDIELRFGLRC